MTTAVIFDLYDTLLHLPVNVNPYMRLFRSVDCMHRMRESMIVDAPTLVDFCNHLGVSPPHEIDQMQQQLDADIASAALFADVVPTLQTLRRRGVRLGVISNLATPYKAPFFRLGLDQLVDTAIFSCDVGIQKPVPQIYHAALNAIRIAPKDALMVGDSQTSDVDGPKACGMNAFLLDRDQQNSGDSRIHTLYEVESLLD